MLRGVIKGIVNLVYPEICIACKKRIGHKSAINNLVCEECWKKIMPNIPPFCSSCGRSLRGSYITKNTCPSCIRKQLHFDRAFSPCVYDGIIKELIHQFKYKGKDYLGPVLSKPMIEHIKEYGLPINYIDYIMPIPLHNTRLREREFNQAEVLAKPIAKEFAKEVLTDVLQRNRPTRTQTDLEPSERFANVKDSFSILKKDIIQGKNILLIDDVLTTGATSSEASRSLKQSGAGIVYVLTVAN